MPLMSGNLRQLRSHPFASGAHHKHGFTLLYGYHVPTGSVWVFWGPETEWVPAGRVTGLGVPIWYPATGRLIKGRQIDLERNVP